MKRILRGAAPLALLLTTAMPASAAEPLIDTRFGGVRLMDNRSVRVSFEYACPSGYEYQALGRPWTMLYVDQPADAVVSGTRGFRTEVICDGTRHILVKRLRPPVGDAFDPQLFLIAHLYIGVDSELDPYPGPLLTEEVDTFRFEGIGSATLVADMHIRQVRLNDRGRLVVTVSYRCPTGWFVDVVDDADWADISGRQDKPVANDSTFWEPLGDDIVCDDTSRTLVKRVSDQQPEGFDRTLPIDIRAKMILNGPTGHGYIYSAEGYTVPIS